MTDKPTSDDIDAETGLDSDAESADAGTAGRPSPSAASRARRIGGRPTPGARPSPTPTTSTKPGSSAKGTKSAKDPDSTATARRGGLRAARAAATERAVEVDRPAPSVRTRAPSKPSKPVVRDPKATATARRRRAELLRWLPAGVLGLAVAVLVVLCVALGSGVWYATKSANEVRGEVLAAAKTCTGKVSSYDYRKLAQSKKDGLSCATGQFKKDYATAMDTIIAKEAPKTKTTQSVQVAKAGIEQVSSDGRQWTLLIYGQHTVTNIGLKTPRLDKLSVRVTMDKVGNKWLISKLNLVDG